MKTILSTKKLTLPQKELCLNGGLSLVEYNAIQTEYLKTTIKDQGYLIFTSQNGVKAYLQNAKNYAGKAVFCVGEKTKSLLLKKGFLVIAMKENALELGQHIVKKYKNETFTYYSGNLRRDELSSVFNKNNIRYKEVCLYHTLLNIKEFNQSFDGVLFFSPSGIKSYVAKNSIRKEAVFCIGTTTAREVKKYTNNYIVATKPTVENVLVQAVNYFRKND